MLHTASNRTIGVEVLANRTIARKRSADLLADTADGAVLGESAADGTLCVERCGGFLVSGVLAAGEGVSMIEMRCLRWRVGEVVDFDVRGCLVGGVGAAHCCGFGVDWIC